MEYNYEVKIDDLRKQYEGELEAIVSNYNEKMVAMAEEHVENLA